MKLEHYSLDKLSSEVLDILERNLGNRKFRVFYFGSRALGKGSGRSDIDIGIEADEAIPRSTLFKMREEIDDLNLLYKIDLVDFRLVSDDFLKVVGNKRKYIN